MSIEMYYLSPSAENCPPNKIKYLSSGGRYANHMTDANTYSLAQTYKTISEWFEPLRRIPASSQKMQPPRVRRKYQAFLAKKDLAPRPKETGRRLLERDIQNHFYRFLEFYIPGAQKAVRVMTAGHLPDGFVRINGETAPVEVKRTKFTIKGLEQLQWYMRIYDCKIGVAVAQELCCDLPEGVRFVKVSLNRSGCLPDI